MKSTYWVRFVCLCILSSFLIRDSHAENGEEEFVATKEWQEVKPGQMIPPGLHVKMDLQKGGKWAKLMDEQNSETQVSESKVVLVSQEESKDADSSKDSHKAGLNEHTVEELKSALKKMKEEKTDETLKREEEIKSKFRSMDEIKAAFEELNLRQESDFETMQKLLEIYVTNNSSFSSKLAALQDLEYYVHQVDNANDFVKMNGLATIAQALNSTSPEIKQEAAHVIGSAVQSNPSVKVEAIKLDVLSTLVRITSDSTQPLETRKKAVYAISALIRHFPAAQYFFSDAGGFSVLRTLFNERGLVKLQLKSISLLNDLMVEREEAKHLDKESEQNKEKIRQYNLFSLPSVISQLGFCEGLTTLLDTNAHDQRETILTAMKNLKDVCSHETNYLKTVSDLLRKFQDEYENLLKTEEEEGDKDSFFHYMFNTVTGLLQTFDKNLSHAHSEL